MSKAQVMVELQRGYGDGYGIIQVDDAGKMVEATGRKATHYIDGSKIPDHLRAILSQPSVSLGGVVVPTSAIKRVIGPLDCEEAVTVRAKQMTGSWVNKAFVDMASVEELRDALSQGDSYKAMCELRTKYAA